jgi:hypothetical protein
VRGKDDLFDNDVGSAVALRNVRREYVFEHNGIICLPNTDAGASLRNRQDRDAMVEKWLDELESGRLRALQLPLSDVWAESGSTNCSARYRRCRKKIFEKSLSNIDSK